MPVLPPEERKDKVVRMESDRTRDASQLRPVMREMKEGMMRKTSERAGWVDPAVYHTSYNGQVR